VCGKTGQACCNIGIDCSDPNTVCGPPDAHNDIRYCAHCGGPGELCCDGNSCTNNGCCVYGYSSTLLAAASTCVPIGNDCGIGTASVCGGGASPMYGSCGGTCGLDFQPCCHNTAGPYFNYDVCTAPHTYCDTSMPAALTCKLCGLAGLPCCGANSLKAGAAGGSCIDGSTCKQKGTTSTYTCQ
jgi:hypothetical protein